MLFYFFFFFFFFNDTATTEIYTLSLHDALPIWKSCLRRNFQKDAASDAFQAAGAERRRMNLAVLQDRKSTRLNSSHLVISYAVFCLKKKKKKKIKHENMTNKNRVEYKNSTLLDI